MSNEIIKTGGRLAAPLAVRLPESTTQARSPQNSDDSVLDIAGLLRVLSRRRRWIYMSILTFVALAGTACFLTTPKYKATAHLELLKQEQGTLAAAPGEGQSSAGATSAEDSLNFNLTLQTAVSVLQSDALALRVIRELNLADTPEFKYNPRFKTEKKLREMALPLEESPLKRTLILKKWSKLLKVDSVAGTRVLEVSFSHSDPQVAAKIVNQLVSDYIDYRYELRYEAAQKSTEWLNSKLASVKTQAEDAAKRLADASKDAGIYGFDSGGPNGQGIHNLAATRLDQLNTDLADAQRSRAAKEAVYKLASSGDPELVAGLVNGASPVGSNTPSLLMTFRQQEAELNTQYAEAASKYGPENPKLIQIKNKLAATREDIKAESQKITGRARQEYLAALANEASASKALEDGKRVAAQMNDKAATYGLAKHEADSSQELYERLLQTAKETPILAGIRSTDINVVDAAIPPGQPASPVVPLYLAGGAFVGTLFGVVGAFLRDSVDTSLRSPEDIEAITQLPVLGVIPRAEFSKGKRKKGLSAGKGEVESLALSSRTKNKPTMLAGLSDPQSIVMEAFRSVRSSILLSRPDNPRRIFMVTSSQPGEGKSFTSLHLSSALVQNGGTVLLVDADLRRGTLSRTLKMAFRGGLSTLISGTLESGVYREVEAIPGLTFLPAGASPPNPAESLGSRKMAALIEEWREKFDFVVIDSPPILPVTDAAVLSQVVDGVVMVTRFAVSKQQAIMRSVRTLLSVRAELFGVLVNDMDTKSSEYGYYGTYGYGNEGESVIEAEPEMVAASAERN